MDVREVPIENLSRTERFRKFLFSEEFADVTFLVGVTKYPMKANKLILRLASNVFYKIFAYSEKEENAYEIPEVEPEEFKILLDYFYTGEVSLAFKDPAKLLRGANLYGAREIIEICVKKLTEMLNIENCVSTLVLAIETQNPALETLAIQFICRPDSAKLLFNPSLACYSFTEESLLKVLPKDELAVDEVGLFQAIVNWGKAKVSLSSGNQANNPKELRSVLDKLIPHIRFPLISKSDFTLKVYPTGLLTETEVIAVLLYYNIDLGHGANFPAGNFSTKPRAAHGPPMVAQRT